MNNNLLALPIVLPMVTAVAALLLRKRLAAQKTVVAASTAVGLVGSIVLLLQVRSQGIQTLFVGDFPAPFGIALVADVFGAVMVVASMVVGAAVLLYSFMTMDEKRERGFYYAFFQFLLMGVNGSFLTGDLFNLFVWFEVLLIASYILLTLGGEPYQLQEGFKYVVINIAASALFLISVAATYATLGTMNMADLAVKAQEAQNGGVITLLGVLFLIVFGIKGAVFPLYFWLPRSYFAPPTAVAALFGGLLTKVGVYAIVRFFTLIFIRDPGYTNALLLWIAGFTMVLGGLGAISQMDFKRILSYHIISQIGYMIMGLGIFTTLAIAGAVYFIVHNMVVKTALFLAGGVTERLTGTTDLKKMGGLHATHPALGVLFFVAAMAMAGVPPLSGFFGKLTLLQAGIGAGRYWIVAVGMLTGMLTLFSMIKIFRTAFWGEPALNRGDQPRAKASYGALLLPLTGLVIVAVAMGLGAQAVVGIALEAAEQMMNPDVYIEATLGRR